MTEVQSMEETRRRMRRIDRGRPILNGILPAVVMDDNEKEALLLVLYDTKILNDIIKAGADAYIRKGFHNQLTIDPSTGSITHLKLDRTIAHDMYNFKVPPSIRLLKNLVGISLVNCTGLSIELNHLQLLEEIEFRLCEQELFGTIPNGLRLPKVKKITMTDFDLGDHYQIFNSFSGVIEEIYLGFSSWNGDFDENPVKCKRIFDAIKKNDGLAGLRNNLKKVTMDSCGLKSKDLRRYLVEFHRLYPNLRELDLSDNLEIESFKGIADDIRKEHYDGNDTMQDCTQPINLNLRKIILQHGPICYDAGLPETSPFLSVINDKEIANAMDLLHIFQGITHLGGSLDVYRRYLYHPTVENVLRKNAMRASLSEGVLSKKMPSDLALWPFILEKVHKNSVTEIYQLLLKTDHWDEDIKRKNQTTDEDEVLYMGPVEPKREDCSSKEEYECLAIQYVDELSDYQNQMQDEEEYDPAEEKRQYAELLEYTKDASVVFELLRRNATSPPCTNILLQRTHDNH